MSNRGRRFYQRLNLHAGRGGRLTHTPITTPTAEPAPKDPPVPPEADTSLWQMPEAFIRFLMDGFGALPCVRQARRGRILARRTGGAGTQAPAAERRAPMSIPGTTIYQPFDPATGQGGRSVYTPLTPRSAAPSPHVPAAGSDTATGSGQRASPSRPNHRGYCRSSGCRRLQQMLRPVARLVRKFVPIAFGISVGLGVWGGTSHPTNGDSTNTGQRP